MPIANWYASRVDYTNLLARGDEPLYRRLVSGITRSIESNALAAGARLPSEREMAELLSVSRTTVVTAYRELESQGLVRSHVGRGTYICARPDPSEAPFAWRGKLSPRAAQVSDNVSISDLLRDACRDGIISFAVSTPSFESFPLARFRAAVDELLRTRAEEALGLSPTEGQPRLRRAIAERFGARLGCVLIVAGSQQGIHLVARSLIEPGDAVVIDRPGYVGAIQAFRSAGANLVGWDTRGDLDELEELLLRYRPKLIYVDPTFQNPTGRVLTLAQRSELLSLAARYRTPIIEDDPWSETYLDVAPPPSLWNLDHFKIVIHLGSFSKTLAPGLRLGWILAPESIIAQLTGLKQNEAIFTPGLAQLALSTLIESGAYDQHLETLRTAHAKKRDALEAALRRHMSSLARYVRPGGGMHYWLRLDPRIDCRRLLSAALERGVAFAPGEIFYADGAGRNEIRLCYTGVAPRKIEEGVKLLATTVRTHLESESGQDALPRWA